MKLITALVFAAIVFANAEGSFSQTLNLGIKGGYNTAGVTPSTVRVGVFDINTEMKSGFNVYIFKDIISLLVVNVSGELGYTQKGFDVPVVITNDLGQVIGEDDIHCNVNYIDLSIIGKLKLPGLALNPYVLAGPSLGIKAGSSVSFARGSANETGFETVVDDFKGTSFGMKFGIGTEITAIPLITLLAEGRYNPDITNSYEEGNVKLKNKVFEFLVGVKF